MVKIMKIWKVHRSHSRHLWQSVHYKSECQWPETNLCHLCNCEYVKQPTSIQLHISQWK